MKAIITTSLILSLPFLPLAGNPVSESSSALEVSEQVDSLVVDAQDNVIEPTGRELFEPEPDQEMELIEAEGEFELLDDDAEETPKEVGTMTFDPYASQRKRQTRNFIIAAIAAVAAGLAIAFAPNNSNKDCSPENNPN